jgi:hypothetical protein
MRILMKEIYKGIEVRIGKHFSENLRKNIDTIDMKLEEMMERIFIVLEVDRKDMVKLVERGNYLIIY